MPKLWNDTIAAHRHAVRDAILDATWELVREHGPLSVTMSQIAEAAGIGRATLYKYFPDVEAILVAWHERQVAGHLTRLAALRERAGDVDARLQALLEAYAGICHQRAQHGGEIGALVHRAAHVVRAEQELTGLFRDVLADAAMHGRVRDDVASDELASYCLHALGAAADLPSKAAVQRLVRLTYAGLRPPR